MATAGAQTTNVQDVQTGTPIHVVATTTSGTRRALAAALRLAGATDSHIYVIARSPVTVGASCVEAADSARAFADAIREIPEASSSRVKVLAALSRRAADLFPLLPPRALVYLGGHAGRWWPSAEQRLARQFSRLGCRVVFVHEPWEPAPA